MRPDPSATDEPARAVGLWRELTSVYDQLEHALSTQAWDTLGTLAHRISTIERQLEPLSTRGTTQPRDPAAAPLWQEADAHARALADRFPRIERTARTARDAAAAQLAKARIGRSRTDTYAATAPLSPRFTSQRA